MRTFSFLDRNWLWTYSTLFISFALALFLRVVVINQYGFSEDEVMKALAAQSYARFDFSANASHPALMKLLITFSVAFFGESEFAIRLPNAVIGALTVYPIFFLGKKLYNEKIGLFASFLWAVHIPAISVSTTAKEDTLSTFFWVFAVYFFILAKEDSHNLRFSGLCAGLTLASKYSSFLLIILLLALFFLCQRKDPFYPSYKESTILFVPPAVIAFLAANFSLFFPKTIGNLWDHYAPESPELTGWIMMGQLLSQRPPYYLLLHIVVKTPILFLGLLILGIGFALKDRSDSDNTLLIWIALVLGFFSITGYGYTRYYLVVIPAFSLLAAQGTYQFSYWGLNQIHKSPQVKLSWIATTSIIFVVSFHSLLICAEVYPYYRMYVNELGGGKEKAGYYFPQDSVYDYLLREAIQFINKRAPQDSVIAMNTPVVGEYYGRSDLQFITIREMPTDIDQWEAYNVSYAIVQDSRIFFENREQIENLRKEKEPEITFEIFETEVVQIFRIS